jgi:hypothetical protein
MGWGGCIRFNPAGWAREKSEIRNSKFEIAIEIPAMMNMTAAGVAEWQTLGT